MSAQNNSPIPEDFQKKLQEFMKTQYGDKVVFSNIAPQTERVEETPEQHEPTEKSYSFEFNFKPKEIKAHLDRFVIKQDEAKKVLSIAVCDHYNHVKAAARGQARGEYNKQNVILLGPTGVGKTYLIRCIAELIGVPFVKGDATKFSETGYVGGDVEDLVRELVQRADGDVKLAQYGIIYLDEIDKIATPPNIIGRDVSGRGVQTNLLKLMEETEVPLRSPTDIQAQLQAAFEFQRKGKVKKDTINTRHILFIVSGAFDKIEEIVRSRLRAAHIGFGAATREEVSAAQLYRQVNTRDFIKYGFEPEFIGRLPVRVVCDELTVEDLYHILKNSEGSVVRQYEASFTAFGVEVIFADDGLRAIAELAAKEQTGARGLLTVCERALREYKYELPSSSVKQFVVNRPLVEHPIEELKRVLANPEAEQRLVLREMVFDWAERFQQRHRLTLRFADAAVDAVVDRAQHENKTVREMCNHLFKDFEFGLGLIRNHKGQTEFEIPSSAIADPSKFLSDLVLASYPAREPKPAAGGS
jgi:endopeptidase Clp ATP-binding regulatory subunit ClpX